MKLAHAKKCGRRRQRRKGRKFYRPTVLSASFSSSSGCGTTAAMEAARVATVVTVPVGAAAVAVVTVPAEEETAVVVATRGEEETTAEFSRSWTTRDALTHEREGHFSA